MIIKITILLFRFEMQIFIRYLFFALFFLNSLQTICNDKILGGLYFQSYEVDKDKRTCLDLTPQKPLVFHQGFSMKFDLKMRHDEQKFGYIFRIVSNDTLNIDFLVNMSSEINNFSVIVKNQTVLQYNNSEVEYNIENTWIKAEFVFDPIVNCISFSLNGIKKEAACILADLDHFNVYFGGNLHKVFSTTDIAPMTVKNIRFFNEKKEMIRYWELGKHLSDTVLDECIFDRAEVFNPIWEIGRHVEWEKKKNIVFSGQNYQIAFDRIESRFYFVGNKRIFVYDIIQQNIDTIEILAGSSFNIDLSNHIIYDPNYRILLSYDLEDKRLAAFDFSTYRWNNSDNAAIIPRHSHHSRLFIAEDSLLVTFGGYGHHRYSSMFYKCSVGKNQWDITDLSKSISPRYLGSIGRLDDRNILYFGGFGNESGLQEESPRNYYELYSINIDNSDVKKIWDLPSPGEHFTNSNSLVIDKNSRKFYALAYPNKRYASEILLHEYSLDKPQYRAVGNPIPYFFNDIESYCDLFQSSDSSVLYAITFHARNNSSDINIYSLAFPPLSQEEIIQHSPAHSNLRTWFLLGALLIVSAGVFLVYRKRKASRTIIEKSIMTKQIDDKDEESVSHENLLVEKKPSSIGLLGNFQVIDSNGHDITRNFTPTTTQIFLLLLMFTIKNGRGISSQELRNILWFDKDDDSARNNRNVYIAKLRSILKSFIELKLINNEGYWSIQSDESVFCDYEKVLNLMKTLKTSTRFNKKLLAELIDIALKGTLLPYIQQLEWLESFLSDYSGKLIECLLKYSKHDEIKTDLLFLLKIADTILLHDNIDEDAITLKCYALFRFGRKNQALQAFNKFTSDYENLLVTKHNLTFDEIVK